MFKGLGNLASLMKHAGQLKSRLGEMPEKLARIKVEGTSGGGMVTVEANGNQKLLSLSIEPTLIVDQDREMIEDLVLAAVNQALEKARNEAASQMADMGGGMEIPGLDDALKQFGLGGAPDSDDSSAPTS